MHFGSSQRLLYGVYDPAVSSRLRRGVLLLNPYGWEALRAHRTLRTLALRLSKEGFDVLRFDYSSTGDSLGATEDASWDDWLEDADYAVEELQAVAGVQKVSLVGLRMGALVAQQLAAQRRDAVDRQVLWAPPAGGGEVVEWARAGHDDEVAAFPLGERLERQLHTVEPGGAGAPGVQSLVLGQASSEPARSPSQGSEFVALPPDGAPCWVEDRDFGAGAVPVELLNHISRWLAT